MKVLVLSDTHGLLRPQVQELLAQCDAVIHGGDLAARETEEALKAAVRPGTPLFIVRGNNDRGWASHLPGHLEFVLGHVKFYVVHEKKDLPEDLGDCQVVIFGHSHKYTQEMRDGRLYLNPGSCGRRRFRQDITVALLYLENGRVSVERMEISSQDAVISDSMKAESAAPPSGNPLRTIREIMKRMDKGQQIGRISAEMRLDRDFVEDICRIRVTHPGVTANGILDKIEVNSRYGK